MPARYDRRTVLLVLSSGLLCFLAACSHHTPAANKTQSPTRTAAATAAVTGATTPAATATSSITPTPSATATATAAGATPVNGASFQVGNVTVIVDRFRAQITASGGVNIRSAPTVSTTNRIGSLATGAIVQVEGRVPKGQEAEPGHGTTWYYLGTAGSTAQYIYGAPGTLQPLTGSTTPAPTPSAPPSPPPPPPPPSPPATATP